LEDVVRTYGYIGKHRLFLVPLAMSFISKSELRFVARRHSIKVALKWARVDTYEKRPP
jgi:hypothetical protein